MYGSKQIPFVIQYCINLIISRVGFEFSCWYFTFRASQSSKSSISGMLLPCVADGIWDVKGLFLVLALHLSVIPAWSHHGKGFSPQSPPSLKSRILFLLGLWWEKGIFFLSSSSMCWGFSWQPYLKWHPSSNLMTL